MNGYEKNLTIEVHALLPYSINSANRGEYGEVKSATIGGVSRAVMSSQSLKYAMRTAMANSHLRTNYYVNKLIEMCYEIDTEKRDDANFVLYVLNACDISLKDNMKKQKKESDAEYGERILSAIANGEGIKSGTTEVTSEAELHDIAKIMLESYDLKDDKVVVQKKLRNMDRWVDLWTSSFGRMSTNALFSTIDGAVSTSMSYSVDRFLHQNDYFTVVDSLQKKYSSNPGAANTQDSSIAANLMYRYMNISIDTLAENFALYKKIQSNDVKNDPTAREFVDFICELIKRFLYTHPIAKQHSMASVPTPSTVAIFTGKNISVCDMNTAFNKIIVPDQEYSTAEKAALRAVDWTENDMIFDQYDTATIWVPKTVRDSNTVETRHAINNCRQYVDLDLKETIWSYIEKK